MKSTLLLISFCWMVTVALSQSTVVLQDSSKKIIAANKSAVAYGNANYKPGTAIKRSAIIPGWGQATNKSYWKIPVVYATLGTTAFIFFRNVKQFKEARDAYNLATDNDPSNDYLIKQPYFTVKDQPGRIKTFRDQVRQNIDYSALFFIVFWGLNVVDAAVEAHLKTFDVSDDLSLHVKPGFSELAGTNGISLVLTLK